MSESGDYAVVAKLALPNPDSKSKDVTVEGLVSNAVSVKVTDN